MITKIQVICLLCGSIFFCILNSAKAQQVRIGVYGQQHHNIKSYNGYSPDQDHRIHFQLSGLGVSVPNWSIRATILQPLNSNPANISGRPFPTEKIKFRFTTEEIEGAVVPANQLPTLQNLQAPLSPIPFQPVGMETPMITNAPVPLATGSSYYANINLMFKLEIEGGRYLEEMLSNVGGVPWNMTPALYNTTIRFSLYNGQQELISYTDYPLAIQVHRPLTDQPSDEGEGFSIEITGQARDGKLAFNVPEDYLEANSVTYSNGIKINAQSGYQLKVKSTQAAFLSGQGHDLPLDVLRVQLRSTADSPADAVLSSIRLSNLPQTIASSNSGARTTQYFDLEYATDAKDKRLSGTRPGKYSTILLYEISPR